MVGNTEFAEFVQKLRTISSETDGGEFLRGLLYKIGPKGDHEFLTTVAHCSIISLRQYYRGQTGIAGAFFDFEYDKPGFESFLESLSDGQVGQLVDAFGSEIPEINSMNLSQVLPDKLGRILANRKKRGPKRNTLASRQNIGQQFLNFNAPNQDNQYKLSRESMNHCEYPDCPKILYDTDNPNAGPLCEVVFIDENATNKDDDSNLAVMCPDCARKYKNGHSPEIVAGVRKRKDDLLHEFNSMLRLSERKLTEGAEILLRNVQNLPGIKAKFPETFPTDIENKIKPEYRDLLVKLGPLSSTYFDTIENLQKDLTTAGVLDFDGFKDLMKSAYHDEKRRTDNQNTIFYNLAQWLRGTTNVDFIICEAVLTYFVQICEVFDDLSKQTV